MDRLVDTNLSATAFAPDAQDRRLPARARTVIVGGGLIGCSTAHHLAAHGETDVLVLDANVIGSGTTWHAAGLVSSLRSTPALTEFAAYGVQTYAGLEAASGIDVSFRQSGSLLLARTPGRMDELRYTASVGRYFDIPAAMIGPDEVAALWPLASTDRLLGALHQPQDGYLNPGHAALAFAKLAYERGVTLRENVRVQSLRTRDDRIVGVETALGFVECERVLLATGLWTRDLAAAAGATVPLYPAEHVHVRTALLTGADPALPVLRDLDGYFYIRPESGALLVGAFEPNGVPRPVESIDDGGFAQFPAAWEHFAPVRRMAEERVPALRDIAFERFLNAPESFTPDANFCLGETAEVANLYVAAGFNSQGIIYGPGVGRAAAEWMVSGSPAFDAGAVDVRRFARQQGNRRYLHARTREGLGRLYAMHWPHQQPATARNVRRSPLHERLAAAGACFGETAGWERPDWFAPPGVEARTVYSYGRQNWFDIVRGEHRAAREAVALVDLSASAKVEVAGPDAGAVLQTLHTADLDATVLRLATDRFWLLAPATAQLRIVETLRRATRGRAAASFDATAGYAAIGVVGPRSRELLELISPDDFSDDALPEGAIRTIEAGDGYAVCRRVGVITPLGYELYPSADQAVNVYDALVEAGRDLGLRHAGARAWESLAAETGVSPTTGAESRREPSGSHAARITLRDPDAVLLGQEPVLVSDRVVGRVTSASYGYTLGRAVGLAAVESDLALDAEVVVDCGGTLQPADLDDRISP